MTQGLLQLSLFGRDKVVRGHPTQFTEVIHANFELNRSAGEVGEFGCHPIGTTALISTSERPMATPDIWTKSRVVCRRLHCLISAAGSTWRCRHPGAPAVIGLTRLYCNQGERFLLIDVASEEAPKRAEELLKDGWEIEAAIPV